MKTAAWQIPPNSRLHSSDDRRSSALGEINCLFVYANGEIGTRWIAMEDTHTQMHTTLSTCLTHGLLAASSTIIITALPSRFQGPRSPRSLWPVRQV